MKRRLSGIKTFLAKRFSDKRGSSTILLAILLTTMMTITVSFVTISQDKSEISRVNDIMTLAGR